MKQLNLTRKALTWLFAPFALAALPAYAQENTDPSGDATILEISPNAESGINGASYTGTDKDGNIFGFNGVCISIDSWNLTEAIDPETGNYIYTEDGYLMYRITEPSSMGEGLSFTGAKTENKTLSVPSSVSVKYTLSDEDKQQYLNMGYHILDESPYSFQAYTYGISLTGNTSFPDSPNLTDLVFDWSPYSAYWCGDEFETAKNYHFNAEPYFHVTSGQFVNVSKSIVNIILPDDIYFEHILDYKNSIEGNITLRTESDLVPVNVNVATPGTLADEISNLVENLNTVRWVVVTGTPNDIDLRILRRLPRLEILDLSQTTGLTSVGGCNELKFLREVILPEGITSIDNNAFENCISLQTINIPEGVTEIGDYAFRNTGSLGYLNLPVTTTTIGDYAFSLSGIMEINLSKVSTIRSSAFEFCRNLQEVTLSDDLEYIGWCAFHNCDIHGTLTIPDRVRGISGYAFSHNYNIDTIVLGKNLSEIESYAFAYCSPKTVINHALFPSSSNGFIDANLSGCTLYVPALTLNDYLLSDAWVKFSIIEPLAEDLTELTIDREYTLTSDKGIADKANLYMAGHMGCGSLTVNRKTDLNLGNYAQQAYFDYYSDSDLNYFGSTIIPESVVTADNIEITISLDREHWHFLSFPFDVNVKDIVVDEDALWVVRKYSGEDRAALTENTWQNMTDDTVLKAGEGYIFHCAVENRDQVTFKFKPAANGNALFAKDIVTKELASYPSEFAHNASWNLVGNTFPAFMTIKGLEFEAPVTVWQNGTYYAYSPVDDDYVFSPFQAFFVQRQEIEGGDVIALNPQGRAHSSEAAAQIVITDKNGVARAPRINSDRALFNIFVKGENGTDRTRLVINKEASAAYESNRDASKFMSSEMSVPQIFVMNNNNRMAIDELPLGEGEFTLGTRFGAAGDYSISLETRNAEGYSVLLTDNTTGITTDITASEYAFTAEEGTDNNRFTLRLVPGVETGVEEIVAEGVKVSMNGNVLTVAAAEAVEITVTSADGMVVALDNAANFSATLANGVYVVKAGNTVTKVIAGK